MSLILDALDKADRERKSNLESDDATEPTGNKAAPNTGHRRFFWFGALASVAIVALAGSVFLVLRQPKETAPPAVAMNASPVAQAVQEQRNERPKLVKQPAQAPTPKPAEIAEQKAIAVQYAQAAEEQNPAAAVTAASEPEPVVKALYDIPPATPTPAPTPEPTPPPTPESTAEPKPAPSQAPPPQSVAQEPTLAFFTQLGTIRSLPWTVQEKIPSLTYSAHNYNSMQDGSVVINGATRRRGDTVAPDLVLEMVLVDGIILKYKGQAFKVPALSSWVNM